MSDFDIISSSQKTADFESSFSNAQNKIRKGIFRQGILPESVWITFFKMPVPFEREFWIAKSSEGETLGRIGANVSATRNETGYIGFFEVDVDAPAAAKISQKLLSTAETWLKSKSVDHIYGPINFNTWFPYRFRQPSETSDKIFSWEPINPPQYVHYFKDNNFKDAQAYHSTCIESLGELVQGTEKGFEKATAAGLTFRSFDQQNFLETEIPILYQISMTGFSQNFLFEPITLEAFRGLYVPIINKLDFKYCFMVEDADSNPQGFIFSFEDDQNLVIKSITINPEARGKGLSNALVHISAKKAFSDGLKGQVSAMVKGGAQSESYSKKSNVLWRHEYILFEKEI